MAKSALKDKTDALDTFESYTHLLAFFRLSGEECALLKECWPIVSSELPKILDSFYKFIFQYPPLKEKIDRYIGGDTTHLKEAKKKHWERLFSGTFDDDYFHHAKRIGKTHEQIGLEPLWYIGSYTYIMDQLQQTFVAKYWFKKEKLGRILNTLNRALSLDIQVVLSVYIGASEATKVKDEMLLLASKLHLEIRDALESMKNVSKNVQQFAATMKQSAAHVNELSGTVFHSSKATSENVQTVAAATEELEASGREITQRTTHSSNISAEAVAEAENASQAIQILNQAAKHISSVADLITSIASQTNLLALNATIEAARAGDAGKGFAVVANEVKNLAKQTASATTEVSTQINSIQHATSGVVHAIERIKQTVTQVNVIAGDIASSIEQQIQATAEISRRSQEVSSSTLEVSQTMGAVVQESEETGQLAQEVLSAASSLANHMLAMQERLNSILRYSSSGHQDSPKHHLADLAAKLTKDGRIIQGHILNVSEDECLFVSASSDVVAQPGSAVTLEVTPLNLTIQATLASITEGTQYHLRFNTPQLELVAQL